YAKTVEANANEIKEKETELKELKREKKMCDDKLYQIKSDYEADMEAKNAEQQKVQQAMLQREKELCVDKLHTLQSEYEAEIESHERDIEQNKKAL
uniref:Uncharacterized protein n=1 Tax=Amphimedon queenslandica TaxID=400682 RepID=A0A1X7T7W7_AMPQE